MLSASTKRPFGGVFLFRAGFWAGCAWALLIGCWLNASHYRPWLNFQSEFMAFVGVALLFATLAWQARPATLALPAAAWFALALLAIPLLQWATGLLFFGGDFWLALIYLAGLAAAIACGYLKGREARHMAHAGLFGALPFGIFLWLPAVLSALIGVLQWLDYSVILGTWANHDEIGARPMGNIAQTNQMATLLLMGACAVWHDFEAGKLGRFTAALLLMLLTVVMVFTQSRTGLLSASVLAVFLFWRLRRQASSAFKTPAWLPLGWLGLVWLTSALVPWINDALLLGGNRNIALMDPNSRQVLWAQMWYAITQSPWWGYGWNQTATAHNVGALGHPGKLTYGYAHNLVLDLTAWCGIPLGIAITLALAYWLLTRLRRVQGTTGIAAMAALLPFTVHSLLEFPFAYGYFLAAAGILIGLVEAHLDRPPQTAPVSSRTALICAALYAALGLVITHDYIGAEKEFAVVRFNGMRIGKVPPDHEFPKILVLNQLDAMLRAGWLEPTPGMPAQQIELLRKVAKRFPYGALGYHYALALALNGNPAAAAEQLRVMHGMYGDGYYQALLLALQNLQMTRYPQLRALGLWESNSAASVGSGEI